MGLGEKLRKSRKKNNYSQEQLADKLEVSVLTLSNWEFEKESPDNEMILKICRILNCNVNYLLDDNIEDDDIIEEDEPREKSVTTSDLTEKDEVKDSTIRDDVAEQDSNKSDTSNKIDSVLNFINNSYNMLCNMDFKKRIRCLCEMLVAAVILLIAGIILYKTLHNFMQNIIGYTKIGKQIVNIISSIFDIGIKIVGLIIWIQFYKIRYLNQFVVQEKNNKEKKKINFKIPNFKIPSGLGKSMSIVLKILIVVCALPIIALFICLICFMVMSIYHIQYAEIFIFIAGILAGSGLLIYVLIEIAYKFVISERMSLEGVFARLIIGLIIIGIGIGLTISTYVSYEPIDSLAEEEYLTKTITMPMENGLVLNLLNCEYRVGSSINDIQIEIKYPNNVDCTLEYNYFKPYTEYYIKQDFKLLDTYKLVLRDLKDKRIRDYNMEKYTKVIITTSQSNYNRLKANYEDSIKIK